MKKEKRDKAKNFVKLRKKVEKISKNSMALMGHNNLRRKIVTTSLTDLICKCIVLELCEDHCSEGVST